MGKGWAVCPRIEDRERPDKPQSPKLFDTEKSAVRFLNSLVRWSRERLQQREDALRRYRAGEISQLNFPQHLIRHKNREDGWEGPFSVVGVDTREPAAARTFEAFLPLSEVGHVPERALDDLINRIFEGRGAHYRCLLSNEWNFDEIEDDMWNRAGHLFEGRNYQSIAQIVVKAIYDAQAGLSHLHPGIDRRSISLFFMSWQFWRHMAEFCQRVGESTTGRTLAGDWMKSRGLATAAYEWICEQLSAYSYELSPWPVGDAGKESERSQAPKKVTRAHLRNSYFAQFPNERILILDVCWAAGEHYREWKRWLQKRSPIKDGQKADRAFRGILTSGKRPLEYRAAARPDGWQ